MAISVQEATQIVLAHPFNWEAETVPFPKGLGRVLAEDIHADAPLPPFDRVMMDGIAVRFSDWQSGQLQFPLVGLQAAGSPRLNIEQNGVAAEVMTGAILPKGLDTVIRYEDLEIADNQVVVTIAPTKKGKNVHPKGFDRKRGELLIPAGQKVSAADIAVLASVGKTEVKVKSLPKVCVVSTGDELVEVWEKPLPHQIRKSNGHALAAALKKEQIQATMLHLLDEESVILEKVKAALDHHDALVLSGGVSKGKFDHLPACFERLGVKKLFHIVQQRPGKPFWFGTAPNGCKVFAFPGNPVSTFMCMHRYFLPWLRQSFGHEPLPQLYAELQSDFSFKPPLTYFLQVNLSFSDDGKLLAVPETGQGSGDLANLADVSAFLELEAEREHFPKGSVHRVIVFRDLF